MPALVGVQTKELSKPSSCKADFGIEVHRIDLENLNDDDFAILRQKLYEHSVVVIKNQQTLSPKAQYELTKRFDPLADTYSHGKSIDKRSVLHSDLKTIPSQPQVQVIGNGFVKSFEGLENITLKHPHHRTFHKQVVPEAEDLEYTHFYRWHIDSAMYGLDPPRVTSLMAVRVPRGRKQICRYDDGSGHELEVPLGTTAFFSGYRLFDMLSDTDKEFVRSSRIEYGAHPYIWMSKAKSRPNGLGLLCEGLELEDNELPPVEPEKVRIYPMAWRNPVNGRLAMMVYPTAAKKIHLEDGTVIDDLKEVRDILYRLQRPAIEPELIYPHDWEEGDLVLFNNHGVMHSIVGAFAADETRIFRQCNMAASEPPAGPMSSVE